MAFSPKVTAQSQEGITKIGTIGRPGLAIGQAQGLAIDTNGNTFLSSSSDEKVFRLDTDGVITNTFGGSGSGDGRFSNIGDVAVDTEGNVYVADQYNHRVQKFDNNGNYLSQFGSEGSGNGEFSHPSSVAVDSSGNIFVADNYNRRIQKFDNNGTYLSQFGSQGAGDGQFESSSHIEVDSNGSVYVLDDSNYRVQKFDNNGTYLSQFGSQGAGDGQFEESPRDLSILSNGNTAVLTRNKVIIFNETGVYQTSFEPGFARSSEVFDVDNDGNFYVAGLIQQDVIRIMKFNSAFEFQAEIDGSNGADTSYPYGVAADSENNVFVTSVVSGKVLRFDASGTFETSWSYGSYMPVVVSVNNTSVYATTFGANTAYSVTDKNGEGLQSYGSALSFPSFGIAAMQNGEVYHLNRDQHKVEKFSADGQIIDEFGSEGSGDGQLQILSEGGAGLAVDTVGNVYVSDNGNNRIQKFDSSGGFISKWGSQGDDPGQFDTLTGIAVDANGNVYAASGDDGSYNNKIVKYSPRGEFLSEYVHDYNPEDDERFTPIGIATGANGRIYVANLETSQVDILCDNDVSADGCAVNDVPNQSGDNTISNKTDGKSIIMAAPSGTKLSQFSAVSPGAVNADASNVTYEYPMGLVGFSLDDVEQGGTVNVSIFFETTLKPDDVVPRKYMTRTKQFKDVPNATITTATYADKQGLRLSYSIKDGGELDQDSIPNTTITDPVGLAVEKPGLLANTGDLVILAIPVGASLLLAVFLVTYLDYRKHKKPLKEADPYNASTYTYWHHLRTVTIPLFSYRLSFAFETKRSASP